MRKKKSRYGGFFFSIKVCVRYKVFFFPTVVKYSFTSSFFSHGTQKKGNTMIYRTYWDWGKKNVKTNHSTRKTKKKRERKTKKKTENSVISAAVLSALRRAARTPFRQCGANPLR